MYIDNLGYLPEIGFRLTPDRGALIQGDLELTFAQLEARANRVANGLIDLGVRPGDRVVLLFSNDERFVESFLGVMRAGAVVVPANIRLGFDNLRHVVADCGARVMLASPDQRETGERLADRVPAVRHLLVDGSAHPRATSYAAWIEAASPDRPPVSTGPDDLCMQPYTSGSTGRPKGVLLPHFGQVHNADAMRRILMVENTDRALIAVPLYHANGLCGALMPFLMAGGSAVIMPAFDAVAIIRAIERHRVTYTTGVPAMYKLILRERELLARHDVSSIRYLACGSAPVPAELIRQLEATFAGADIVESYGLTEGGPVVACLPRWGIRKLGSTGLLLPDVRARIMAADGRTELGPEEIGELWVKGPGNTIGYHNLPEVTAVKLTPDGWLRTGDLMRFDADGYYYFMGRADDMINCGGENVYPKEVETVLLQHGAVADACVVPAPHETKGEAPVAFVVARGPDAPTAEQLRAFFFQHGPAYAHPRHIFFLDSLPLNGTGKLDRQALARRARDLLAAEPPAAAQ